MLNFCDFIQVFVFTTNHHLKSEFILSTISFTNNMNSNGELGSPNFRPILDSKKCENEDLYLTHSLTIL